MPKEKLRAIQLLLAVCTGLVILAIWNEGAFCGYVFAVLAAMCFSGAFVGLTERE